MPRTKQAGRKTPASKKPRFAVQPDSEVLKQALKPAAEEHVVDEMLCFIKALSSDRLAEVLSKLDDAKAVGRAACVSKSWHEISRKVSRLKFCCNRIGAIDGFSSLVEKCMCLKHLCIDASSLLQDFAWATVLEGWLQTCTISECLESFTFTGGYTTIDREFMVILSGCPKLSSLRLGLFCETGSGLHISSRINFSQLKELELRGLQMHDQQLSKLVSCCPIIEEVRLFSLKGAKTPFLTSASLDRFESEGLRSVTLDAPKLASFSFRVSKAYAKVILWRAENLVELELLCAAKIVFDVAPRELKSLRVDGAWQRTKLDELLAMFSKVRNLDVQCALLGPKLDLCELVSHFRDLESLTLGCNFIKGGDLEVLPGTLRKLFLRYWYGDKDLLDIVSSFLKNCPLLRDLRLHVKEHRDRNFYNRLLALPVKYPLVKLSLDVEPSTSNDNGDYNDESAGNDEDHEDEESDEDDDEKCDCC